MTPDSETRGGGLSYRIRELEEAVRNLDNTVQEQSLTLTRLEPLPAEVKSLRRAAYWVAGVIVAGAIGFAFSVLVFIPPG